MKKILLSITSILAVVLMGTFASQAHAVITHAPSIRIENPASSGDREFKINWVTLDIQNRTGIVRCFKKGPSDGGFIQYGSNIAVQAGGDNGICNVTSSTVSADGSYQFYATMTPTGGSAVQSLTVTADINTKGPKTPTNYSKNKTGCEYTIKFKTGEDSGETVKVEIYRSEATSFVAEAATKVHEIAIGSNENVTYKESPADCAKTYYYAVRAFNAAGVGSGIVGDSITNVTFTSSSSSTTSTTTTETGGTTEGGAIPVGGTNIAEGGDAGAAVGDEEAEEEGSSDEAGDSESSDTEGDVLGETTADQSFFIKYRTPIIAGIILLVIIFLYGIYRRAKSTQ